MQLLMSGTLKHLGVLWDMSLTNEQQYDKIVTFLRMSTAYVVGRKAFVDAKLLTINKCIDGLTGHPAELLDGLGHETLLLSVTGDRHCKRNGEAMNKCTVREVLQRSAEPPFFLIHRLCYNVTSHV
jgi:hypothetical protein